MIRSKKELKFYIQADRIMAGYEDGGWLHKMKYRLAGMPASIKKNRKIWYEEDGGIYIERVKRIELLKKQMLNE